MDQPNNFYQVVESLKQTNRPFAIATVINVKGSASAKPGSKAVIDETGKNVWGWVGGGCAESFVAKNALEAISEGRTRIIQADLDDEIFGLGMPCGGIMDVYIEPQKPTEKIVIREDAHVASLARHLANHLHLEASVEESTACLNGTELERALFALALAIGHSRSASLEALRKTKGVYAESAISSSAQTSSRELLIIGSSRITEELASFGSIAKWNVRVYGWNFDKGLYPKDVTLEEASPDFANFQVAPGSAVVVASHHKGDHEFIRKSLEANAFYVGLVASAKRSGLVFEHLRSLGLAEDEVKKVYAPSGINLECSDPAEIALSCFAEILQLRESLVSASAIETSN